MDIKIKESWQAILCSEFKKEYFIKLMEFVKDAYNSNTIYPPAKDIFNAFNLCPYNKIKVVIIGQDPYHGPNQAHGLCFSVQKDAKIPPSLRNIFKEINLDLGLPIPSNGNLNRWAKQGVLLLNATLTVEEQKPGSHQKKGWEIFTNQVIKNISAQKENIVFLLWGAHAQLKAELIDQTKHLVLKSVHPSPLSASRGFFGNHHFSNTNNYLEKNNNDKICW